MIFEVPSFPESWFCPILKKGTIDFMVNVERNELTHVKVLGMVTGTYESSLNPVTVIMQIEFFVLPSSEA